MTGYPFRLSKMFSFSSLPNMFQELSWRLTSFGVSQSKINKLLSGDVIDGALHGSTRFTTPFCIYYCNQIDDFYWSHAVTCFWSISRFRRFNLSCSWFYDGLTKNQDFLFLLFLYMRFAWDLFSEVGLKKSYTKRIKCSGWTLNGTFVLVFIPSVCYFLLCIGAFFLSCKCGAIYVILLLHIYSV